MLFIAYIYTIFHLDSHIFLGQILYMIEGRHIVLF